MKLPENMHIGSQSVATSTPLRWRPGLLSGTVKRILLFVLSASGGMSLSACSLHGPAQPSTLVIMVENLGFGAFSCGETETDDDNGFKPFCDEAVRFTHAYAPSPLSQPTVASILTAQYPVEHGVRHNGAQGLSATVETLGERARRVGYHTSFYSGGPPIWRRSGFNQGFEVFDDAFAVTSRHLYRPAHTLAESFLAWQETEAPRGHFLSFLFFADPQFTNTATTNSLGELRDSSYASQIEEVSETLRDLVRDLKHRDLWDSTEVILVGLNGYAADPRLGEPLGMNLYSESTHVTLMIKPRRLKSSTRTSSNWKIDSNVSLVDVGATLFRLVDPKGAQPTSKVGTVSLASVLETPDPDWPSDRMILSETAWPAWRKFGGIRASVRKGSLLYIHDQKNLLFDTLNDSLETSPIAWGDVGYNAERVEMANFIESFGFRPWLAEDRLWIEKTELGRDLWHSGEPPRETRLRLQKLSERAGGAEAFMGWRARVDIMTSNWQDLNTIAAHSPAHPSWKFVAEKNLGKKAEIPLDPCFSFLRAPPKASSSLRTVTKECTDDLVRDFVAASDDGASESARNQAMESLVRRYGKLLLIESVAELNYSSALKWDTSFEVLDTPQPIELLLALPEFKKLKQNLKLHLSRSI